jgi:hypothetical protein
MWMNFSARYASSGEVSGVRRASCRILVLFWARVLFWHSVPKVRPPTTVEHEITLYFAEFGTR